MNTNLPTATMLRSLYKIALLICLSSLVYGQETLSSSALLTTDIQQRQPATDITQLLAGSEEISVMTQEATVPLTRGVAIIITEAQHGLFGGNGVSSIADSLNQWGWYTLILPALGPHIFEW